MPNHVTNHLTVTGPVDDVAAFKQLMVVKEDSNLPPWDGAEAIEEPKWTETFDFNRLSPMPEILSRVVSPVRRGPNGRIILYGDNKSNRYTDEREATEDEQAILDKADPNNWYDWALKNWGTKWNSYSFGELKNEATYGVAFDTAWSTPEPIIDDLVEKFPNLTFEVSWFDEGWCHAGDGILRANTPVSVTEQLYREPNDMIYEKVYGDPPSHEEDDLLIPLPAFVFGLSPEEQLRPWADTVDECLRAVENFECQDVESASDKNGFYPITATYYSDDYELADDDQIHAWSRDRERIRQAAGLF